jgi:hypothetical protein
VEEETEKEGREEEEGKGIPPWDLNIPKEVEKSESF